MPLQSPDEEEELSEDPAKMLKADAKGNLIIQERTRLNIEKLAALYTRDELQQRLRVMEQTLPMAAYGQVVDLLDRYNNFIQAAKQTYPPGYSPATVEVAIVQHEGLTMEEKAIKAQEMLSKAPELAAAYEQNRTAATKNGAGQ